MSASVIVLAWPDRIATCPSALGGTCLLRGGHGNRTRTGFTRICFQDRRRKPTSTYPPFSAPRLGTGALPPGRSRGRFAPSSADRERVVVPKRSPLP